AQSFSNLVWALGTLVIQPGPLIYAASSRCLLKLHTSDAQEIANTVWALARLDFIGRPLC
ncbi:unnamed protein product, partial [Polarella glacialis]